MDEKKGAIAAVANPHLDDLLERARGGKPPEAEPRGECVVCHGQLVPDETLEVTSRHGMQNVQHGWYCVRCGLKYKHLPSRPEELHH